MKKRHIASIAAVWIMAIAGITISELQKKGDGEDMRILNISVEVSDDQYMALKRRAARTGKAQESWTVDDEITYTAAAALSVMAEEEMRRERTALRNAQITDDYIVDEIPIRVVPARKEVEVTPPTLSEDPAGEPEAEATKNTTSQTDEMQSHITDYDLDLFARCVQAEAGNQTLEGKTAAAEAIWNRKTRSEWPDTIQGVIFQDGQFTVFATGAIWSAEPDEETLQAVQNAINGSRTIPEDYVYFNTSPIGRDCIKIGDHYFGR